MRKHFLGLTAAVATFGFVAQGGTANAFLLQDRSPSVTAAQIVVGAGTFGAYLALTNHDNGKIFSGKFSWKWYGLTTVGCMALTPMLGRAGRTLRRARAEVERGVHDGRRLPRPDPRRLGREGGI